MNHLQRKLNTRHPEDESILENHLMILLKNQYQVLILSGLALKPVPEHDATSFTTTPPLTVDSNFLLNIPGEAMNLMSDEEMNMFMDGVF